MRLRTRIRRLLRPRSLSYENLTGIVLGLGNPGSEYVNTRHNAGQLLLERIVRREGLKLAAGAGPFAVARWRRSGRDVLLARPDSYMNVSGEAAARLSSLTGLAPDRFLVLVDDLELPLGRIRLRGKGSSGGHRGLDSLIEHWGRADFPRLRIGIGRSGGDAADYVLAAFGEEELDTVDRILDAAADAVGEFLDHGLERAMGRFNALEIT